jgi:hypothetical protein
VWDGAKWAAGTVEGSKWTEVANGIYRNGRVVIGGTTVGTDKVLDVVGKFRVKHTTFDTATFIRDIGTFGTAARSIAFNLVLQRTVGVLNNQGPFFGFAVGETSNDILSTIGMVKRASNSGEFVIINRNAGSLRHVATFQLDAGVYIGDELTDFASSVEASSLFVKNRLLTGNFTGTTARYWKLGERKAATVLLDTTQYITVEVNGVVYNLALATV